MVASTAVKAASNSGRIARKPGVAAYGYSDDNVEFEGAIRDEVGAWEGTTIHLTDKGLCQSKCGEGDDCPYFKATLKRARTIKATYSPWLFETDIPHVTFDVMEEGELYCRGIVFRLADAKAKGSQS